MSLPYRRILQIHLCFVYFFSGFDKMLGVNWRNGESIWKVLHLPYFKSDLGISLDFLQAYPAVFVVMGWGVIIIELLYPIFIFRKTTRQLWLLLTLSLHFGIMLSLNLYFFGGLMILLNIAAFWDFSMTATSLEKKTKNRWIQSREFFHTIFKRNAKTQISEPK
ncbi:MAG: hypothetical protein JJU23_11765 [Cyclobacteriaceae bacterium]|nr:hypothetical protein [Cyclobacteriaceae bacterium]